MRTITVIGHGSAGAPPDTVELSVGVRVRARTASAALGDAAERQHKVIEALRAAGVAPGDVQTNQMSCAPAIDDRGQRTSGYDVSTMVHVRHGDVAGAGALIDVVVAAGGDATVVHGVSFSIRDAGDLAHRARAAAFDDARRKAEQHALQAGEVLGRVQSIDGSNGRGAPAPMFRMAASMPVEGGETTVEESVTVVFAMEE